MSATLVVLCSALYLAVLFGVAWFADRRAAVGRSLIANPWVYALSLAVYCTAWTYFGSVGRAASGGVWFLPIYLGPTLAMLLGLFVVRKMIRIARSYRITSIADFVSSRYGKSLWLAGLVTVITVVGIVPYIALQLKAVATGYALLVDEAAPGAGAPWWADSALWVALALAGFTMMFGTRHLDSTERHEGMVAAVAFESVVKLFAFLAVGIYVTWWLFDGPADLFGQALARADLAPLLRLEQGQPFAWAQWFAMTLLAAASVLFLPRQFQVMVVENTDEAHLRQAVWAFPLYLWLINLFVLPIALGGLLLLGGGSPADAFVISLPLATGAESLALLAFIGGLSAATGMVIVEAIAVSTMVCNDLVMPLLLKWWAARGRAAPLDPARWLIGIRRAAIALILLLGYLYFRIAGDAYALVGIGLISFAAVAQFAPVLLGGMYWKGGTRNGAMAGLLVGFALWIYTLLLPSLAKSGWIDAGFVEAGLFGLAALRPEALFGLTGLDALTHALFWSLGGNLAAYVGVSLWRPPSASVASQAVRFVDIDVQPEAGAPVFWRGRAELSELRALLERFLGAPRATALLAEHAVSRGLQPGELPPADARTVEFVETQLAGAIGSASARQLVAEVVEEEPLGIGDVLRILEERSELRAYSRALEEKSRSLEQTGAELRAAYEQLQSLDRMKDEFMSGVTHELRTPLTSIRALSELMADDPDMEPAQRQQFIDLIVTETERLTRLVNQVLDLAKIESGNAEWQLQAVDPAALVQRAVDTTRELFRERGASLSLTVAPVPAVTADPDRVHQVLLNLLSNAAKFVAAGAGAVQVRVAALDGAVRIEVEDNGPGIPEAEQALIFERFRQGERGLASAQGSGLGLPISRQIIEQLGGRLGVVSRPGQGACFWFTLPARGEHA
ncbi:MAG: sensor histidine kinase [Xanthomonadales bacterium]|jgi:Na+/proline symporter/nitrogen-specific signal transduction histidine kinase|nr:sensor histidine kinase [Xanthomonadales bacterium]